MTIGNKIKERRIKKGYTQEDLGKLLDVGKAAICCYEKGIRKPTIDNLYQLVKILEISADELIGTDKIVKKFNKAKQKNENIIK